VGSILSFCELKLTFTEKLKSENRNQKVYKNSNEGLRYFNYWQHVVQ